MKTTNATSRRLAPNIHVARQPLARVDTASHRMTALQRACEASLEVACRGSVLGVDFPTLCGRARRVEFATLPDDDKVRLTHEAVVLHDACARALVAGPEATEVAATLCALYLIHELAHLPQGIGPFEMVGRLRTLGEDALLDLDLGADHVSAVVVSRTNRTSLETVKALQLRGLCGFPVTPEHTAEARRRKARRVVSLVAEIEFGLACEKCYLVADFGAHSSEVVFLSRGAGLTRVVAAASLSRSDVGRLLSAADPLAAGGASPGEVAAILRPVLVAAAA